MARRTVTRALTPDLPSEVHVRPADWARTYQKPLLRALLVDHVKRAIAIWHRKGGKDLTALRALFLLMAQKPGIYAHVFPTLKVAKEVVWQGRLQQEGPRRGEKFLDVFPPQFIHRTNEAELLIELKPLGAQKSGSIYQLIGADNLPKRRGPGYSGVVLSEFQEMPPTVFDEYFEPMLVANDGVAIFCFTPAGKNHAHRLWEFANGRLPTKPAVPWFTQMVTVEQTQRDAPGEDGAPVVTAQQLAEMRARGMPEWLIQQEYYCSFEGNIQGTIFGDLVTLSRREGRVTSVPYDPQYPVGLLLDIGRGDTTAIWFYQAIGRDLRFIDYYENRLQGADHYAHVLKEQRPYQYTRMVLPHDAEQATFTAAETAKAYFQRVGFRGVEVAPRMLVQTGIDATRLLWRRLVFDAVKCAAGLEHLELYRRRWDGEKADFGAEPIHDQHSHAADALRTGVQAGLDRPLEFWDADAPRERYCRMMEDALAPLGGRRFARNDVGGWG
jgi:hypothetical protein